MFKINKPPSDMVAPFIVSDHKVLHYDESPILFTGRNDFGNWVIGSSVEIDPVTKVERLFYSIINDRMHEDFLSGKISYLQLLEKSAPVFVVDELPDKKIEKYYTLEFWEIPLLLRPYRMFAGCRLVPK